MRQLRVPVSAPTTSAPGVPAFGVLINSSAGWVQKTGSTSRETTTVNDIIAALTTFRDERDWKQFHNPKDLALALSIEASELLEAFLWKQADDADPQKIKEELADVFAYAFLLADACQLDVKDIVMAKIRINEQKYPVEKSRGSAKKHNEL